MLSAQLRDSLLQGQGRVQSRGDHYPDRVISRFLLGLGLCYSSFVLFVFLDFEVCYYDIRLDSFFPFIEMFSIKERRLGRPM